MKHAQDGQGSEALQAEKKLQKHLESEVTTLAHCWIMRAKTGRQLGFTEHDSPILLKTVLCQPELVVTAGKSQSEKGFTPGSEEVRGIINSKGLESADLLSGVWDNAEVLVYWVNWQDSSAYKLMRRAYLGAVRYDGQLFHAELMGLAAKLDQRKGHVFSRQCNAELGDAACGVDIHHPDYAYEMQVIEQQGDHRLLLNANAAVPAGFFTHGKIEVLTGPLKGLVQTIVDHEVIPSQSASASTTIRLTLWAELKHTLTTDDRVRVIVGCDKAWTTCQRKFKNPINFQGFPQMPGNDFVLAGPEQASGQNDGATLT
ncbi:DUF2163 domain-containing protein [Polycladidibacter stylochi]|uniref:DUF2163 domain-containing protein n=1 Tax=Polycladidibacter stylochi TaxID=1807766 RepID=UPI000A53D219|nr:DUF2163 domain-containing protein [Pseudovibrio stylochi]